MVRRRLTLPWMNFIRERRKLGIEPKHILNELFKYGVSEEKRIARTFAESHRKAQAELRSLKKANRAFADSVRSSRLYEGESEEPDGGAGGSPDTRRGNDDG